MTCFRAQDGITADGVAGLAGPGWQISFPASVFLCGLAPVTGAAKKYPHDV